MTAAVVWPADGECRPHHHPTPHRGGVVDVGLRCAGVGLGGAGCLSVGRGNLCGVGQAIRAGLEIPVRGVVVSVDNAPVVLRVGMDGATTRVPFVVDERGGAGALFREQIGCSLFDVISLDDRLDMWVDDEAIVGVDMGDRAAVSELVNPVATMIASRFGRRQPVFGAVVITRLAGESAAALDDDQLAQLEHLASASVAVFGEALAARVGGSR